MSTSRQEVLEKRLRDLPYGSEIRASGKVWEKGVFGWGRSGCMSVRLNSYDMAARVLADPRYLKGGVKVIMQEILQARPEPKPPEPVYPEPVTCDPFSPVGRSVATEAISGYCDPLDPCDPEQPGVRTRHLWDAHDSERVRRDPEGWAGHLKVCERCREEA